ncbi:MAG: sigma-70 family RNA polymerase sigma factor [Anaerolineaceae bacterium]|nr:sigma-70 family RNA polymerase sigma factor [Anaerolineaceae bacterium]
MQDLSDAELVERAQAGEREALTILYDRHHTRIFRYVRARIFDTHLAQDLVGEVFLKMVTHLADYRSIDVPFSAWLYRIAHNHVVNHIGRKENQYQHVPLVMANEINSRNDNPARLVERQLALEEMQQALAKIDETQREVIILRFLLGHSLKEVAAMLDKSVAAVKSQQHRGLLALEVAMK